jgi:hypothetical protein
MECKREVSLESGSIWLTPPEYVILRKLQYYREGRSDKHLDDVAGILAVSCEELDWEEPVFTLCFFPNPNQDFPDKKFRKHLIVNVKAFSETDIHSCKDGGVMFSRFTRFWLDRLSALHPVPYALQPGTVSEWRNGP